MNAKPEEMFMQAWKAQLDAGLRAIETDPSQLTRLCAGWARSNAGKSFAYCDTVRRFYNPLGKSGS